jgi:hypothetical protein
METIGSRNDGMEKIHPQCSKHDIQSNFLMFKKKDSFIPFFDG